MQIKSFAPVIDEYSRVLILGTMPGAESLRRQEYYANSRNAFWHIMCEIFEFNSAAPYHERLNLLLKNRIALWDVVESCRREGSLDSNMRDILNNNVAALINESAAEYILLNGKTAEKIFKSKILPGVGRSVELIALPSTSPAYTMPYSSKFALWRQALIKALVLDGEGKPICHTK